MKTLTKILGYLTDFAFIVFLLIPVLFFGSFFLDLFGIRSHPVPMTQDADNAVRIELVNCENDSDWEILRTLTGEEMEAFLADFQKLKAKRYANDPPAPYGDILVAVYYADGCVDRIGEEMNTSADASGNSCPAGGWYYFPDGKLETLFEKYVDHPLS